MWNVDFGLRNKKSKLMKFRVWNFNCQLRTPCLSGRQANSGLQRGFTLIEIIVVIIILSMVSAITVKFLVDSLRIYKMTVNQKTLFDEGKLALERMCRDIRDANTINSPTAGNSATAITLIRDDATAQDGANETITFQRNAGNSTLEKVKTAPAATSRMADNVNTFTVTQGAIATNNLNEMTLYVKFLLATGENVTLQTKVYPKNLAKSLSYKNFYQNWMEAYL
jgi:prepilin-type N-terminal cleavage/methylation domain-containing protein